MYSNNRYTPKAPRQKTYSTSSDSEKDPVQVFCRLRPLKDDKESTCIQLISPTILALTTPADSKAARKEIHYKFRHIFTAFASQKEVFSHVAYPLLQDLLKGKNGLLFTYGVTGSGKTYTLTGEQSNPGIMPRCIDTLFNTIKDHQPPKFVIKSDKMNGFEVQSEADAMQDRLFEVRSNTRTLKSARKAGGDRLSYENDGTRITDINESNLYSVFISYIEIYNNMVFDLLDESSGKSLQSKILREDSQKNMYVNSVVEVEVKSSEEAFEVFNLGQKRKRMGHTNLNAESSRSHSIFNIRVVQLVQVAHDGDGRPRVPDSNVLKIGQLSLVDLAGSERTSRTQNTGIRLKEASSINNSLMSLRTCLEILRENQITGSNKLVPYRDSRLTLLFKNYFEGEGSVSMIVCVNPSEEDFEENLQVMKFAEITQDVKLCRSEPRVTPYTKKAKKHIDTPVSIKVKPTTSFALPKLPQLKLNLEKPEECTISIERLINVLKMRREKGRTMDEELSKKEKHFRKRLVEINQENVLSKSDLKNQRAMLKKERCRTQNLETKMLDMETNTNNLAAKNAELQEMIRSLRNTINEKDMKINQNILEREKLKQRIALANDKMAQEVDAKLRKQREHFSRDLKAKDNKIRKMKELIDSEMPPGETEEIENVEPLSPRSSQQAATTLHQSVTTHQSEHRRNLVATPSARHRRSRSVGEVWLEHNAVKPVPLTTVMQPAMKKRKSLTKLTKASDVTNPKQSKYCLMTQEPDTDGEIETKLYKGDILQTCGGGAQVIFNDVERLRQESPTANKK